MPEVIIENWNIKGIILSVDGITPFGEGKVRIVDLFNGVEYYLGESVLNASGDFSISFSRNHIQQGNSGRLAPEIILRVYDYQGRVLYQSETFVPSAAVHSVYAVLARMPVPEVWHVSGLVFDRNGETPFTDGKIVAQCVESGTEYYLGECGLDTDGRFDIIFSRSQFQFGNVEKNAPDAVFRIYDYSGNLLWQSDMVTLSSSDYVIQPQIGGTVVSDVPENWNVSGSVKRSDFSAVSSVRVNIYDVLYGVEMLLGETFTDGNGAYRIGFAKSDFQSSDSYRIAPNLLVRAFSADDSLLVQSGVLAEAPSETVIDLVLISDEWEISGFVQDADGYAVTLGSVEIYDVSAGYELSLGSAALDSQGQYRVLYSKNAFQLGNPFREAPDILVKLFYPQGVLLMQSAVVENASSKQVMDLILPESSSGESQYCVYGSVTNKAKLPVAHHTVEAFLLRISNGEFSETLLGSAFTDVSGNYEIYYDPSFLEFPILSDPTDHGAETDSIFIRLPRSAASDGSIIYDVSSVICHSAKRQKIDIRVDRASGSDDSEYERVRFALSAYMAAMQNMYDQTEPAFSNRIQYIFCKTGVEDFKVLAFYHSLHMARRIEEALSEAEISFTLDTASDFEKFMYASFRSECPADVASFLAMDSSAYYKVLADAIEARIIAETCTANLPAFWDQWLKLVQLLSSAVNTQKAAPTVGAFAKTILDLFRTPAPFPPVGADYDAWKEQKDRDDKTIQDTVRIYQEVQGDMDAFWKEMWANAGAESNPDHLFTDVFVTQLAFIFDLYSISNGFVPFAQGAFYYFASYKTTSYNPPINTYHIRNLASIGENEWVGMTSYFLNYTEADNKFPDELPGSANNEKLRILAMATRKLYMEKFPVENISESYANSDNEELRSVGEFLKTAEDFNLDSTHIEKYLAAHPDLTVNAAYLKAIQRINRLTEKSEAQEYLLQRELDSSYKISLVEEETFVADHAEGLGGIDEARQIHRLAVMYSTDTLSLLGKFHNSLNFEGNSMAPVSRGLSTATVSNTVPGVSAFSGKEPVPTYETLFGTLSQVQFENNQTVFSPSAYFVDLLEFIDGISRKNLFSRRPELKETDLTQKNAETVLPYIDLVLEMLENAVSPRQFFLLEDSSFAGFLDSAADPVTLPVSAIPPALLEAFEHRGIEIPVTFDLRTSNVNADEWYLQTESWRVLIRRKLIAEMKLAGFLITAYPQTGKEASDLSVMPEHRNPLAYEALSELYFPLQLPLNPGAEEVHETLKLLGVSKHDSIITLCRERNLRYTDADGNLICANFGITQKMRRILEGTNSILSDTPWELWGLLEDGNAIVQADHPDLWVPGSTWIEILSFVPEFMRRTGLNVEGMLDLFALKVLNSDHHITLNATDEGLQTGDPDDYRISGLDKSGLNHIYRLIRLQAILQCSWKDLDNFLTSASQGMPVSLNYLHTAKLFRERYSITWADTGCFWGPIVARSEKRQGKSPFEELFLAKWLSDAAISSMKILLDTDAGITTFGEISSEAKLALRQVLRMSEADLEMIFDRELDTDRYLNLENITKVLRVNLLIKALKLDVEDFYTLKDFSEIDPFHPEKPENLLLFDDMVFRLSDCGVRLKGLWNLLCKAPSTETDTGRVQSLILSLRDIAAEAEAFLSSDAVPVFDTAEELKLFKERYRREQVLSRVKTLLSETFSEFTGGDSELSSLLLSQYKIEEKSLLDLWYGLSQVGWTRSVGTDSQSVDDFRLPADLGGESLVTWSAWFLAGKNGNLTFRLDHDACSVDVRINGNHCVVAEDGSFSPPELTEGEAVRIEIEASDFENLSDFYLEILWDASTVEMPDGTSSPVLERIPITTLIPSDFWTDCDVLQSTLPVFRKMSEYLELTGMSPGIFKILRVKSANSEWKILLPEQLPIQSANSGVWQRFIRLLDILKLCTDFPVDESQLLPAGESDSPFLRMVEELESAPNAATALEKLCVIQNGWDPVRFKELAEKSVPVIDLEESAQAIASPEMLLYMLENMPTLQKIGLPVETLKAIQSANPQDAKVKEFRSCLQVRLGMDSWNKMVTTMMNTLRIRQRDALVTFLLYQGPDLDQDSVPGSSYVSYLRKVLSNAGALQFEEMDTWVALRLYELLTGMPAATHGSEEWSVSSEQWAVLDGRRGYRHENDLYAHFLIDVEMNTDMSTSRIVQASAAIQLYVQRTLMGLEKSSYLNEQDIEQWTWLKNYRLWESNRKIFLYPENWIEPELRDDKTPFFKELEAEFESGEITSEIAKKALGNYLEKMRAVSGLDIIGVYRGDAEVPRTKDTLHIIGKTKSSPHQYFYRRCHQKSNFANIWAPWELIDVDIQADSVLPVFFNGHLHVFWATYKPARYSGEKRTLIHRDGNGALVELPFPQDSTVVEMTLCWSTLVQGKWTAKKQGASFIDINTPFHTEQDQQWNAADHYHFIVDSNTAEYLQIKVFKTNAESTWIYDTGIYTVWHDGENRFQEIPDSTGQAYFIDPHGTIFLQNYATSYKAGAIARSAGALRLLGRTSGGYKMLTANSGLLIGKDEPGFLLEDSRAYFIQRSDNGKTQTTYKMESVSHPIVKEFQKRFGEGDLPGLMRRETQALSMAVGSYYSYSYYSYNYYYSVLLGYYTSGDWQAWDAGQNAFELRYLPNEAILSRPYPMDVVDFNYGSACGIYNWELFFHAPFLIARQLSASQRYQEALDWYHFIFDPRNKLSGYEKTKRWAFKLPAGARFWNFLPFFANPDADKTIASQMGLPDSRGNMPDVQAMKSLVDDWKNDPFNPHLIARGRIVAYQKAVIMHYLDTLVAWADQNFRTDTLESVNEAIQLYILAAEILGTRPQSIPSTLKISPLSYTQMKKKNMDSFSNVVVELENSLVKTSAEARETVQGSVAPSSKQVLGLGPKMFFFTVPRNEKVMAYWDLLDDRLFKIRNGMNIDGVKRQLSLFAPPIDPGLLVRAAAAGIDIGTALNDMFAPVPQYRFTFMVQKAIELCNMVQSMGGAILSALEKKDAEEMARLRADHESVLLKLSREVRQIQIDEAGISIEGLKKSKTSIEFRKQHYEKLIAAGDSGLEKQQLSQMESAAVYNDKANNATLAVKALSGVPAIITGASGFGGSPHVGVTIDILKGAAAVADILASGYNLAAAKLHNSASRAGIRAGYERRLQDWEFQKTAAEKELENIEQQILGAEIRLQVAQLELNHLEKQITQSEEVYEFLKNKYTNRELYQWMVKEIASLYSKNYQLAYDVAKRAEKSYGFELGITDSSFIRFGYWDGLYKGLLSGERLMLDLRRMEVSYIEKNKRELEITKPVSIAQLDPQAILNLQETGECTFSLPEALFDMDFPGHYFRRIRSVRLTIPCVAGPYTSVSAKLTLKTNSMRKSSQVNPGKGDSYPRLDGDDARFVNQLAGIQGIATSQPNGATGMFDFNFRDERYLPFEGAGVISTWSLELPTELRQFDYRSITDVVLTISYTAREDGSLKNAANSWINHSIKEYVEALSDGEPANRLFSLKREFPDAYQSLLASGSANFSITAEHFPYFLKNQPLVLADGDGSQIMALAKGNGQLNQTVQVIFKEPGDGSATEVCNSSLLNEDGTKIYFAPVSDWAKRPVVVDCTIQANFNAFEIDDILLNLNYTVNK
ncbi:MAG: hypothetical protein LBR60_04000 [Fibrobacter sp.]|jgi:hypothetical protein|nr:hypothetical protein [Fibrobacter sp.]